MSRTAEDDDKIDYSFNAGEIRTNLADIPADLPQVSQLGLEVSHLGLESNYQIHSSILLDTAHTTLDTIQEDKELSLQSEKSSENFSTNSRNNFSSTLNDDELSGAVTKNEDTQFSEEKKINLHWINEDDVEDEDDDIYEKNNNKVELENPDVDKGWAWVVLFAVFAIFCLEAGLLSSTGLYYVQMLKEFGHPRSYTAWMGSLVNAFYMLTGPVSSMFIKYTSSRTAIVFGAVLAMTGYLMSAFAESLPFIFFSYGVIVGSCDDLRNLFERGSVLLGGCSSEEVHLRRFCNQIRYQEFLST